jgi:hypothetical protein
MQLYGIVPEVVGLLLWVGRSSNPTLRWEFAFDAAQLEDLRQGQIFQGVAEDGSCDGETAFPGSSGDPPLHQVL